MKIVQAFTLVVAMVFLGSVGMASQSIAAPKAKTQKASSQKVSGKPTEESCRRQAQQAGGHQLARKAAIARCLGR